MRRTLRRRLPGLSYHFGIRPADVDDMPYGELVEYLDALRQIESAARDAAMGR